MVPPRLVCWLLWEDVVMRRSISHVAVLSVFFAITCVPLAASAAIASYPSLLKQGFQTSRLTTHPVSGATGWFVSKRLENGHTMKYFCGLVGNFYQGGKTGVGQLQRGKPTPMSAQAYEGHGKPAISELPKLADLLSGHPRPGKDVANACEATPTDIRVY
jgi:hypothetical protein